MATATVVIADEVGLHARPAARFVQLAGRFGSDIVVRRGERSADAKSMIEVLTLEAGQGDEIALEAPATTPTRPSTPSSHSLRGARPSVLSP